MIRLTRLVVLSLAIPAGLVAQQSSECDVDQRPSRSVNSAMENWGRGATAKKPEDRSRFLREAVRTISGEKAARENPSGSALILGRALVLLAYQPEVIGGPTRGALGFVSNPTATVDPLVLADSALSVVERMSPACAPLVLQWRKIANSPLVNESNRALKASHYDTAAALARRIMIIHAKSPFGPFILAQTNAFEGDTASALKNYRRAMALAATDTGYVDVGRKAALLFTRLDSAAFAATARRYRDMTVKPEVSEEVRKLRLQALAAFNERRFDDALSRYQDALDIALWWPAGHFNRALILGELTRYPEAISEMRKYLALVPDAPDARTALDKIYVWQGAVK